MPEGLISGIFLLAFRLSLILHGCVPQGRKYMGQTQAGDCVRESLRPCSHLRMVIDHLLSHLASPSSLFSLHPQNHPTLQHTSDARLLDSFSFPALAQTLPRAGTVFPILRFHSSTRRNWEGRPRL